MNMVLAFLPKPLLFWSAIAVTVLLGIQSARLDRAQNNVAKYETAVAQCVTTNAQNKTAIEFFKLQNNQCIADREADETKMANAAAAWNAERQLLKEQANDRADRIVEVYREPDCEELAKLNITRVCPAFVDGLRKRAEGNN